MGTNQRSKRVVESRTHVHATKNVGGETFIMLTCFNEQDLSIGRISSKQQRKHLAKDARTIPALPGRGEEAVAVNLWNLAREDSSTDKETSIIPG